MMQTNYSEHLKLRKACVEYMKAHEGDFCIFFETKKAFEKYCNKLQRERTWGDELTLRVMSNAFGVNVHVLTSTEGSGGYYLVYRPDKLRAEFNCGICSNADDVFLVYRAPAHYNVLVHPRANSVHWKSVADSARRWSWAALE